MTIKDFNEFVKENNIPETTKIMVWADHAQDGEFAYEIGISRDHRNIDEEYKSMIWDNDYGQGLYDEDEEENYNLNAEVVAICLYG